MQQLQALPHRNRSTRLSLLAFQAVIYWLWHERNERLHRRVFRDCGSLVRQIDRQIRNRIQSIRYTRPALSSSMMQDWFATE